MRLKLALLALPVLTFPASADAGKAQLDPGFADVGYSENIGDGVNHVTVTAPVASGNYRFTDTGATVNMTAESPCAADNGANAAECPNVDLQTMLIGLGSGNDFANTSAVDINQLAFGGDGNDDFTLGTGNDIFIGLDGNDIVHAGNGDDLMGDGFFAFFPFGGSFFGSGDDQMFGEGGNDRWQVGDRAFDGAGADRMNGGPGVDTVEYTNRPGDLSVSIDNPLLGDGEPGEGDNVQQVEVVRTLGGNDFISDNNVPANALNNVFYGMAGNDTLRGGVGNDKLYGGDDQGLEGSGDDVMNGGAGSDLFDGGDGADTADYGDRADALTLSVDGVANDGATGEKDNIHEDVETVRGGGGRDAMTGSDGRDTLRGGGEGDSIDGGDARDALEGEDGDDVIAARDGAPDTVSCGAGNDMVNADTTDVVASDCELVDRAVVSGSGGEGGGGSGGGGGGGSGGGGSGSGVDDPPILFLVAEGKGRVTKGQKVHAACNEDCTVKLDIQIAAKTAKKYKVKRLLVAKTKTLKMAQQTTLKLKASKRTAKRLRKLKKLKVSLIATATDPGGHVRKVTKKLTLTR